MTHRTTPWVTHPFAVWERAEEADGAIGWARRFRREIAAHTNGGVYLNFIGNEGQERVRAAYGDAKYARLAAIKAAYDPANVFRGNQNIVPLG
jgi:FAD/FMN-containing dehydrogenase